MKIYKCTSSQHNWYVTDRKPTICPCCGKREVRPSIFGIPTEEVFKSSKWHIAGCIPDFPEHRTWGCKNCDAAFWKDTARNKAALGGLLPWEWPKD